MTNPSLPPPHIFKSHLLDNYFLKYMFSYDDKCLFPQKGIIKTTKIPPPQEVTTVNIWVNLFPSI